MSSPLSLPILFAFLSGVAWSGLGVMYKVAEHRRCRGTAFTLVMMLTAGVITFGKALTEPTTWHDGRLWVLGLVVGILCYSSILLVTHAYTLGPASIIWTTVNLSLLVSVLLAPLLFHETFRWGDLGLLLIFVLMLLAFLRGMAGAGDTPAGHPLLFVLVLVLILLMNGLTMLGGKQQYAMYQDGNQAGYCALLFGSGALLAILLQARRGRAAWPTATECQTGALAGLASATGTLLFLGAMSLPTVVGYPISQGTSMLGGVLLTAVLYRERFNTFKVLGLALGIVVLMAAVYRDQFAQWIALSLRTAGINF